MDQFFLGEWGGQAESFQKQYHPTRTQAEATLCPAHTGHTACIYSINFLSAPFLTSWMLESDRCTGRPGWLSVWLFEWLGLCIWQDLPSHDGWRLKHSKEKGKVERKLTALYHGVLYNAHLWNDMRSSISDKSWGN